MHNAHEHVMIDLKTRIKEGTASRRPALSFDIARTLCRTHYANEKKIHFGFTYIDDTLRKSHYLQIIKMFKPVCILSIIRIIKLLFYIFAKYSSNHNNDR